MIFRRNMYLYGTEWTYYEKNLIFNSRIIMYAVGKITAGMFFHPLFI